MRDSPRSRRLGSDWRAMQRLQAESSILEFSTPGPQYGGAPEAYQVAFHGRGLWHPDGSAEVAVRLYHEVGIRLGAGYPRMMPELAWRTPIFHPNISASGVVCLGGYSTHWAPSLQLDELCALLWDMIRYQNYDADSPFNRTAAQWAREQTTFRFPLDPRPLRDRVGRGGSDAFARNAIPHQPVAAPVGREAAAMPPRRLSAPPGDRHVLLAEEIVEAEVVAPRPGRSAGADILFIQ